MHAGHQVDSLRFEDAMAIELASVEQHSGVARQVGGGGEQPGMTRDAPHVPRRRIVDRPAPRRAVYYLRRRNAFEFGFRRQVTRVFHSQGTIDLARDELLEWHPAHPLND